MPAPSDALAAIARARKRDPLAPVTVVAPSHIAAIQLRRRLAEMGPFAGVRFEMLPRLAELLGAAALARDGRSPLARPIGDYLAREVARDAAGELSGVARLPGFARVLRQAFARLRRGGFFRAEEIRSPLQSGLLTEIARLYALFRQRSTGFYDGEDLLDSAAAQVAADAALISELGEIYVLPPGALTAGAERLLRALRRAAGSGRFHLVGAPPVTAEQACVLTPDPASEAREVAREALKALEGGAGLHEIAVFHGADPAYRGLLSQAFQAAGIPATSMPGTPLSETPAGRAVLALAELPLHDYARTAVFDCLGLAPLRPFLPAEGDSQVAAQPSAWLRLAREAGVTRGIDRWQTGIATLITDRQTTLTDPEASEQRRAYIESELRQIRELDSAIRHLISRLEALRRPVRAAVFIQAFTSLVQDYLDPQAPAKDEVIRQIGQLGTIDAVGGEFELDGFAAALRANLDAAYQREGRLGDGVLIADYRIAAGLSFRHVIIAGAYEGVFPAPAPREALVEDRFWAELRSAGHPFLEDAALRLERAREDAARAVAAGTQRVTWTAPLQAAGAGREHYPSQLMLAAAQLREPAIVSATALRGAPQAPWLRRPPSPLAAMLGGPALDATEARLRAAVLSRRQRRPPPASHPLQRALRMLRFRHSSDFTEYDGNLSKLAGDQLIPGGKVSPTSLEYYASCGFRYFLSAVLRLRPPEEPEDRDTIDPRDKGSLVHDTLDEFFRTQQAKGRPAIGERWTEQDRELLVEILERRLDETRRRGRTGLEVYAGSEWRRLRSDLTAFLTADSDFRTANGSRPVAFEQQIPERAFHGIVLRGVADRIDRSPDGTRAWVIDYKTGRADPYANVGSEADPLVGGTKLQLPVYLSAVDDAREAQALYWFITSAGGFETKPFPATPDNLRRFQETLAAILDGVSAGSFPAVPGPEDNRAGYSFKNCTYCDFNKLCSVRRDDEFESKQAHQVVKAWARVAQAATGTPS